MTEEKVQMNRIVGTPGALQAIEDAQQSPLLFLRRHAQGDWGEVCVEDAALNDEALIEGSRLLSSYTTSKGVTVWVISDAESDLGVRGVTTILLPEEY